MKLRNLFLANYAEMRDGLAYITGAFPEWWNVPQVPVQARISLVATFEYESEADANLQYEFTIRVKHPTDQLDALSILKITRGLKRDQPQGSPLFQVAAIPLIVNFHTEGLCEFRLYDVNNTLLGFVPLTVNREPLPSDSEGLNFLFKGSSEEELR